MRGSDPPSLPLLLAAGLLLVNQAPARGAITRSPMTSSLAREGTASVKLADATPAPSDSYEVAPSCVPAWVVDASGIRRLPDRCGTTGASTAPAMPAGVSLSPLPAPSAPAPGAAVTPASSVPAANVPAANVPAASVPAVVTPARTVIDARHVRARASKECSPPTYVDQRGVRRLKPNCL